jgi:probable HAF family extracellular repeat protein
MRRLGVLTCVAVTLFAALALTAQLAAQEPQQKADKPQHYTVHDLGTLGGTVSWAYAINNKGSVTGFANLPGDTAFHAFLWRKGVMTDLGTLGGPNSTDLFYFNERDEVVGASDTSTPDLFGEDFCGFGTYLACAPFLWRNGVMSQLPTLGGNNGQATSINNRGLVVGGVENSTPDDCGLRLFQRKPVIWKNGQIEELPTLSGDTLGAANAINDHGQAVGRSQSCTLWHAVLWKNGTVTDLGSLGGTISQANGINNQDQVFGYSQLSGDLTGHAFLWQKNTGMMDLGTLPGDLGYSEAWGIDNKGRVVGTSCDVNFNCRAFLWQNGVLTDLNTLIPAGSPWFLVEADGINSAGTIVGLAFNMTTGENHAFLATPRGCGSGTECEALAVQRDNRARPTVVLPENVRKLLQQRQGSRFGVGLMRPR